MILLNGHLVALTFLFADLKMSGRVSWPWWECVAPSVLAIAFDFLAWLFTKESCE